MFCRANLSIEYRQVNGWDSPKLGDMLHNTTGSRPVNPFYLALIEFADVAEGDVVLDVGCGTCPVLDLQDKTYQIVGLDLAEGVLKKARKKGGALLLVRGCAENLPFGDNSFDAVISKDVLQFTPHHIRIAREMARVVKPGGNVVVALTLPTPALLTHAFKLRETMSTLEGLGFSMKKEGIGHLCVCGTKP